MRENITRQTKFRLTYRATLERENILVKTQLWGTKGGPAIVNIGSNFAEVYDNQLEYAGNLLDKFTNEGSGWNFLSVDEIKLEYYGLEALAGGSTFKKLPESQMLNMYISLQR